MAQGPTFHSAPDVSDRLQDLVLECADVADMLGELATFSASTFSVNHDLLCGVTLVRRKNQ